jgi:hypothetical protein
MVSVICEINSVVMSSMLKVFGLSVCFSETELDGRFYWKCQKYFYNMKLGSILQISFTSYEEAQISTKICGTLHPFNEEYYPTAHPFELITAVNFQYKTL